MGEINEKILETLKKNIAKKLTRLKSKYPYLNHRVRKDYSIEVINNFKSGEWELSPYFFDSLISKLQEEQIITPREKERLNFTIDLMAIVKETLEEAIENKLIEIPAVEKPVDEIKALEVREKYSGVIGKICITPNTPSTPSTFTFWIKDDPAIHIEPGSIVTVEAPQATTDSTKESKKVIGIVEDVKALSDVPTSISEFYSTGYGNPEEEMALERPIIREAKARIIKRENLWVEPIIRKYPVFFASGEDIIDAYAWNIKENDRILIGFTYDENKQPVPIFGDFQFIFGNKGAHFNIAGSSGLAAKTSYALFLICSALSFARKLTLHNLGIIAFNVKEKDLLKILDFHEHYPNLGKAIYELKNSKSPHLKKSAEIWEEAFRKYDVDPFSIFDKNQITFFKPGVDYKFGFTDIIELGGNTTDTFKILFDPQDIDENFEVLLSVLMEEYKNQDFNTLKEEVRKQLENSSGRRDIRISGVPIHTATISKFLRRLEIALEQLSNVLERDTPRSSQKIRINELKSGQLFVIDIEPLPDRGKRLVFLTILKIINRILEAKREGKNSIKLGSDEVNISQFPNRVAIFIDELNKFAPKGREFSPIKFPIIDIAARGRSVGLSLIGAEQMASQIDGEILANCSTFAVGRAHPVEIGDKAYDWIKGDLRDRVTMLQPGEIVLFHAIHNAPVLLNFPIPLHLIKEV
ncbi:MAG: ATP-binding protein [Candidatus Aenigmarchaeota archaeon]|nr:ATP-binding protein [Candidatus Aenigmarchaeota archaeon]